MSLHARGRIAALVFVAFTAFSVPTQTLGGSAVGSDPMSGGGATYFQPEARNSGLSQAALVAFAARAGLSPEQMAELFAGIRAAARIESLPAMIEAVRAVLIALNFDFTEELLREIAERLLSV